MSEKRWTEMTADEQVPPWGLVVDQVQLRRQLEAHDDAALSEEVERLLRDEGDKP